MSAGMVIGLILLAAVWLYYFLDFWRGSSRTQSISIGGREYKKRLLRGNYGTIQGLEFSLDVPKAIVFRLRRERWYDRMAKALRLIREFQFGLDELDRRAFVIVHQDSVQQNFFTDPKVQAGLLRLMRFDDGTLYCHSVAGRGGHLTVRLKGHWGVSDEHCDQAIIALGDTLAELARRLAMLGELTGFRWDWRHFVAAWLGASAIVFALLAYGLISWYSDLLRFPLVLDDALMSAHARLLALCFTTAAGLISWLLLRRSAAVHTLLIGLVAAVFIGTDFLAYAALKRVNAQGVQPVLEVAHATVLERHRIRRRRSAYLFELQLDHARFRRLRVPRDIYDDVGEGDEVALDIYSGRLGYTWIASPRIVRRKPQPHTALTQEPEKQDQDRELMRAAELRRQEQERCPIPLEVPETTLPVAFHAERGDPMRQRLRKARGEAQRIDLALNQPGTSLLLLLSASRSTLWHLRWTPGTQIAGIMTLGHMRQHVAGIPFDTPQVPMRLVEDPRCQKLRRLGYSDDAFRELARTLSLPEPARHVIEVEDGRFVLGPSLDDPAAYLQAEENAPRLYYDGLPGGSRLDLALKVGILRRIDPGEIQRWPQLAFDPGRLNRPIYVVSGPVTLPIGGHFPNGAPILLVPEDAPVPIGRTNGETVLLMKDGRCRGTCPMACADC